VSYVIDIDIATTVYLIIHARGRQPRLGSFLGRSGRS